MINAFETPRLRLRKAAESDLELIWRRVWSDAGLAEKMLWTPTETLEDAKKRMERTIAYQTAYHAFFVCLKESNEPIGFAGFREIRRGEYEESGVCIAKAWQGHSYGKETLSALVEIAFEHLGGWRFVCGCFHDNLPSAGTIKSCGFVYTHSEDRVRQHDGYPYQCDFYERIRSHEP